MKAVFLAGNRVELLKNGGQYFPALLAAIDGAQHEVHLESYIFADDDTGRAIAAAPAAIRKVRRSSIRLLRSELRL